MSDRDRLAADLNAAMDEVDPVVSDETYAAAIADRLIALGWTRLDGSYDPLTHDEMAELVENPMLVHLYDAHRLVAALVRPLDEERLERALVVPLFDLFGFDERLSDDALVILAAAIAKAYREDAG